MFFLYSVSFTVEHCISFDAYKDWVEMFLGIFVVHMLMHHAYIACRHCIDTVASEPGRVFGL